MRFQINEFGGASPEGGDDVSEIERSTALARRARLGDYDESMRHARESIEVYAYFRQISSSNNWPGTESSSQTMVWPNSAKPS